MRFVQVLVSEEKREAIVDILDDEDIEFVLTEEASDHDPTAVISFPLPTPAVEPILTRLRDVQADEDSYTVVTEAETVLSSQFEDIEAHESDAQNTTRIAREELFSRAEDMSPVFGIGVPPGNEAPNLSETIERQADLWIQSAFNVPGISPLIDTNRAEIDVRYVLRES